MKTLIRNRATQAFLTREGAWTRELDQAWSITSLMDAITAEERFKLRNVELYCCYEGEPSKRDCTIPLDGCSGGEQFWFAALARGQRNERNELAARERTEGTERRPNL